jgi:hypothetical protein
MIDFPASPVSGDRFAVGDFVYVWDGNSWTTQTLDFDFSFASQIDVEMAVTQTSAGAYIPVSGPVSVTGGEYQIASDSGFTSIVTDWTSVASNISAGQYIRVRHTASTNWSTVTTTTLSVRDVSRTFVSTTRAAIVVTLTTLGANSWSVPSNWYSSRNIVEVISGGGAGNDGTINSNSGGGGGGAGYARKDNLTLTPGGSANYFVGSASQESWFDSNTTVRASGGSACADRVGGNGGAGTHGDVLRTGGKGGDGGFRYGASPFYAGGRGGGGGAAGPNANGTNGGNGNNGTSGGAGADGGGGANGGSPAGSGGGATDAGSNYGGGGGGAYPGSGAGAGAQGCIRITY